MVLRIRPVKTYTGHLWWKKYYQRYELQSLENKTAPNLSGGLYYFEQWVGLSTFNTIPEASAAKTQLELATKNN